MASLRTLLALVGVCLLGYVVLAALARRGVGRGASRDGGRLRILEQIALSQRHKLFLVRVDDRELLLSCSDGGTPALVTELPSKTLPSGGER